MVGVVVAAALLLLVAGVGKIRRPHATALALRGISMPPALTGAVPVRLLGAVEIGIAGAVLGLPAGPITLLLAATYGVLAAVAAVMIRRRPGKDCGCFGAAAPAPVGPGHVLLNLGFTAAAVIATLRGDPAPVSVLTGAAGGLIWVQAVLLAVSAYLVMTVLPGLTALRLKVGSQG